MQPYCSNCSACGKDVVHCDLPVNFAFEQGYQHPSRASANPPSRATGHKPKTLASRHFLGACMSECREPHLLEVCQIVLVGHVEQGAVSVASWGLRSGPGPAASPPPTARSPTRARTSAGAAIPAVRQATGASAGTTHVNAPFTCQLKVVHKDHLMHTDVSLPLIDTGIQSLS